MQQLAIRISPTVFEFHDLGGYESRNASTLRMLRDAWERYIRDPDAPPMTPVVLHFATNDVYEPSMDFSYGVPSAQHANRCFPHFIFDGWKETGLPSYSHAFDAMVEAGKHPPRDPRVGWRGALTNLFRKDACALSAKYPASMDFQLIAWNRSTPSNLAAGTPTYVPLVDQCAYRVLIDLGAGGFSARLPLLFASGRPVILVERVCEAWFYWDMTPWVHYIPSPATEAGLLETVRWTESHPEEAAAIGRRGQSYALEWLTYDAVLRRCADVLRARLSREGVG